MKKIVLAVAVFIWMGALPRANAQKGSFDDTNPLSFYGVDFSFAKVYGARETSDQFLEAFVKINDLFVSEPKKYSVSKTFGVKSDQLFNKQVKRDVDNISRRELFTDDNSYFVTDADIDQVVKKIEKQGDGRYGAVIVCGLLNKTANHGTFTFVVFDQDTQEIVFQQEATGKARGFGLRNFWAGALHAAMKSVK